MTEKLIVDKSPIIQEWTKINIDKTMWMNNVAILNVIDVPPSNQVHNVNIFLSLCGGKDSWEMRYLYSNSVHDCLERY